MHSWRWPACSRQHTKSSFGLFFLLVSISAMLSTSPFFLSGLPAPLFVVSLAARDPGLAWPSQTYIKT